MSLHRVRARSGVLAVVVAGLALLLGSAGLTTADAAAVHRPGSGPAALSRPSVDHVALSWVQRASGFVQPVQMTPALDGVARLFVVERRGTIRVVHDGVIRRGTYLDIRGRVNSSGDEQGLLSVVFDPAFKTHPRLWVAYTRGDGALVVAVLRAAGPRAGHVRASTARTVLVVPHPLYSNHNGGLLRFGPDGMLYIGTGDGGYGGDPFGAAENLRDLRGKILRIDARHHCGSHRYCIPASNPFAGRKPGRGEIWLYGLRNPWRWSFDPATRALWIGDVGQDHIEEIDRVPAHPGRRNLGWSCWEGRSHYNTGRCRSGARYVFPVAQVVHPNGEAIIGGYVYRGKAYASLMAGTYVFADEVTDHVWVYRKGQGKRLQAKDIPGGPTSFALDEHNEIWAVSLDGRLWSMRARAR